MKKTILVGLALTIGLVSCKKDDDHDDHDHSFNGSLTITSAMELEEAMEHLDEVSSLSGDLTVTTGGNSGITAAEASKVTKLIKNVSGNVSINTPDGSLTLYNLKTVGGNYSVSGTDANDNILTTVGGNISLDYPGGYSMTYLTSSGDIDLAPNIAVSSAKGDNVPAGINFPNVNARSISTVGHRDGMLDFGSSGYTTINLGVNVYIDYIAAPFATNIVSMYEGALNGLFVDAPLAQNVSIATGAINGEVNVTTNNTTLFAAPSLVTVQGNVNISSGVVAINTVTSIQGNVTITAPTINGNSIQNISGDLNVSTNEISMNSITIVGGNLTVAGVDGEAAETASFGNLATVGGEVSVDADSVTSGGQHIHNSGGNGHNHNSGGN